MKNLLPIIDNLIEDKPKRLTKYHDRYDRRYYRSWSAFLGKVAMVNPDNLLGLHHDTIVGKYLHTLPEMYRDLQHLYYYLKISKISKDGMFIDPLWGRVESGCWKRKLYHFNENGILCVKITAKPKKKQGTRAERLKEFHEKKKAKKKTNREFKAQKEEYYTNLLGNIEYKRKEKEEKINLQKIISHGFDPLTSFRPEYKAK